MYIIIYRGVKLSMRTEFTVNFLRTFKALKEESGKGEFIDFYDKTGKNRIRIDCRNNLIKDIEDDTVLFVRPLEEVSTMRMDIFRRQLHILDLKGTEVYTIKMKR